MAMHEPRSRVVSAETNGNVVTGTSEADNVSADLRFGKIEVLVQLVAIGGYKRATYRVGVVVGAAACNSDDIESVLTIPVVSIKRKTQ